MDDRTDDLSPVEDTDLGELYHENSKLRRVDHALFKWIRFFLEAPEAQQLSARAVKSYRGRPRVALPPLSELPPTTRGFDELVRTRRSERAFEGPVPLADVARVLHHGYGVVRTVPLAADGSLLARFRAVPSGGALYPLEVYLAALQIEGLAPGLYHYNPRDHALEQLDAAHHGPALGGAMFAPEVVHGAAGVAITTGVFARSALKYQKRAYRFVLLEAGHVAQNMILTLGALGLGSVPIGGFIDDEVNRLLGVDGVNEAAVYLLPFGRAARRAT